MASTAQTLANRANAQHSTGPITEEGKAKSSQNARRHGLLAESGCYFSDEEQEDYQQLENALRLECKPGSEAENQTFQRYAFNSYQLIRAQRFEVEAQEAYFLDSSELTFRRMERMTKLTAIIERRVDKALNELRKLQRDRFHSLEIENEMFLFEKHAPIPVSLPVVEMAKSDLRKTNPFQLAVMILNQTNPINPAAAASPHQSPASDESPAPSRNTSSPADSPETRP